MFMPVFARVPRTLLALIALCFTLGLSACGGSAMTSVTTLTSAGHQQGGGQASQVAVTGAVTGTIASVGTCHVETGNQFRAVWTETIGGTLYLFQIVAPQFNAAGAFQTGTTEGSPAVSLTAQGQSTIWNSQLTQQSGTFTVNANQTSGTVDAVLTADSGTPPTTVHVSGSWACARP
jgi:hypothetical protein